MHGTRLTATIELIEVDRIRLEKTAESDVGQ
jgi:hypothetical protein